MTSYAPSPLATIGGGRPPCANCGAAYRLHRLAGGIDVPPEDAPEIRPGGTRYLLRRGADKLIAAGAYACPEAYRPTTIEEAQAELARAQASEDAERIFVARGNLQRLQRAQHERRDAAAAADPAARSHLYGERPELDSPAHHHQFLRTLGWRCSCGITREEYRDEREEQRRTAEPPTPWRGSASDPDMGGWEPRS